MTRLIDADALKGEIAKATYSFEQIPIRVDKVQEIIDNAPTVEPPKQLVLRARDDAELEQLKEAWSKGTINFAPIVAYTERMPIKCPDCKYFNKKWITDNRRKDKGYWNCWCSQHEFWVGGKDGYCSLAERKEENGRMENYR